MGERLSSDVSDTIVIYAKEGGVGMRDIDSNHGNPRCCYLVGDDGSGFVLNLKLDDKVDSTVDKLLRVVNSGGNVIVIVEYVEVDTGGSGGLLEALRNGDGKWHVGTLAGKAEAELSGTAGDAVEAIAGVREVATVSEGFEN